jgi:hypothetical protein
MLTAMFLVHQGLRHHRLQSPVVRDTQFFKELSVLKGAFFMPVTLAGGTVNPAARNLLSSHPVFRMPPAATSWASCLDDVLLLDEFEVSHDVNSSSIQNVNLIFHITWNWRDRDEKKPAAKLVFIELGGVKLDQILHLLV